MAIMQINCIFHTEFSVSNNESTVDCQWEHKDSKCEKWDVDVREANEIGCDVHICAEAWLSSSVNGNKTFWSNRRCLN